VRDGRARRRACTAPRARSRTDRNRGRQVEKTTASGFGLRVLLDLIRRFFARLFGRGAS
jgi:hypothetical protein